MQGLGLASNVEIGQPGYVPNYRSLYLDTLSQQDLAGHSSTKLRVHKKNVDDPPCFDSLPTADIDRVCPQRLHKTLQHGGHAQDTLPKNFKDELSMQPRQSAEMSRNCPKCFLSTDDTPGSRPGPKSGIARPRNTDPLRPIYSLAIAPSEVFGEAAVPRSVRDSLDVSDIEGAQPKKRDVTAPRSSHMDVHDIEGATPGWQPPYRDQLGKQTREAWERTSGLNVMDINTYMHARQPQNRPHAGLPKGHPDGPHKPSHIKPRKDSSIMDNSLRTTDVEGLRLQRKKDNDPWVNKFKRRQYRKINDVSDIPGARTINRYEYQQQHKQLLSENQHRHEAHLHAQQVMHEMVCDRDTLERTWTALKQTDKDKAGLIEGYKFKKVLQDCRVAVTSEQADVLVAGLSDNAGFLNYRMFARVLLRKVPFDDEEARPPPRRCASKPPPRGRSSAPWCSDTRVESDNPSRPPAARQRPFSAPPSDRGHSSTCGTNLHATTPRATSPQNARRDEAGNCAPVMTAANKVLKAVTTAEAATANKGQQPHLPQPRPSSPVHALAQHASLASLQVQRPWPINQPIQPPSPINTTLQLRSLTCPAVYSPHSPLTFFSPEQLWQPQSPITPKVTQVAADFSQSHPPTSPTLQAVTRVAQPASPISPMVQPCSPPVTHRSQDPTLVPSSPAPGHAGPAHFKPAGTDPAITMLAVHSADQRNSAQQQDLANRQVWTVESPTSPYSAVATVATGIAPHDTINKPADLHLPIARPMPTNGRHGRDPAMLHEQWWPDSVAAPLCSTLDEEPSTPSQSEGGCLVCDCETPTSLRISPLKSQLMTDELVESAPSTPCYQRPQSPWKCASLEQQKLRQVMEEELPIQVQSLEQIKVSVQEAEEMKGSLVQLTTSKEDSEIFLCMQRDKQEQRYQLWTAPVAPAEVIQQDNREGAPVAVPPAIMTAPAEIITTPATASVPVITTVPRIVTTPAGPHSPIYNHWTAIAPFAYPLTPDITPTAAATPAHTLGTVDASTSPTPPAGVAAATLQRQPSTTAAADMPAAGRPTAAKREGSSGWPPEPVAYRPQRRPKQGRDQTSRKGTLGRVQPANANKLGISRFRSSLAGMARSLSSWRPACAALHARPKHGSRCSRVSQ